VAQKLLRQVEFYFSDVNLTRDAFFKERIAENRFGYVPLSVILKCKKIAEHTQEISVLADALKDSTELAVNEAKDAVKRVNPMPVSLDFTPQTIIIFPIVDELTQEKISDATQRLVPEAKIVAVWRKQKRDPTTAFLVNMAEVILQDAETVEELLKKIEAGEEFLTLSSTEDKEPVPTPKVMRKTTFEELKSKLVGGLQKKKKRGVAPSVTIDDIRGCVCLLSASMPLGAIRTIKAKLSDELKEKLVYVHVLEGVKDKMYIVAADKEALQQMQSVYSKCTIPKEGDDEKESPETLKVSVEDDEKLLTEIVEALAKRSQYLKKSGSQGKYQQKRKRQ